MNNLQYVDNSINVLHDKINSGLKTTVKWAVELGAKLDKAKKNVGHGNFIEWISKNCSFNRDTANRYMNCYKHSANVLEFRHLQDAYKEVSRLEHIEKENDAQRKDRLVNEKIKTGINPEGWTRDCDYAYEKKIKEENERTERLKAGKEQAKKEYEERSQKKEKFKADTEFLRDALNNLSNKSETQNKYKVEGTDQKFMYVAIDNYLRSLDNNRQLEAIAGIIKYCKSLHIKIQQGGVI